MVFILKGRKILNCHFNHHTFFQVSFQQTFEAKRSNHLAELQSKEDEMRQMFVLRVKEKESELKDNEKEVSSIRLRFLLSTFFFVIDS